MSNRILVLMAVCGLVFSSSAMASPIILLETRSDFQAAITGGNVMGQTNPLGDPSLAAHYPGDTFKVAEPIAYTPSGIYAPMIGDPDGGVIMRWGTNEDAEVYGQFLYVYDEDPNLVGKRIKATVFAPAGIRSVSLSIIDAAGRPRSWDWNVGGAGPIFNNVLTAITVNIAAQGLGGPGDAAPFANSFFDPLGACNPTTITTLGFDENGNWVRFVNVDPTGGTGPWNYFGRIQTEIIPEPATMSLLLLGGLAAMRRRR